MAKRVSNTALMLEVLDALNKIRTSNLAFMVEYKVNTNYLRTSNIALMIEYSGELVVTPSTPKYGPKWQIM
jgi:hypothetical protein